MDINKYKYLWNVAHDLGKTSSILDVEDNSLTFAKNFKYLKILANTDKSVHVIVPSSVVNHDLGIISLNVNLHFLYPDDDVKYVFTYIHNHINRNKDPKINIIGNNCGIHPTAIIGLPGNCLCDCPDGTMMNLKHMGNVVIEDNVEIQALSIIHRACFTSTTIKKNAKIFCKVNIGHNCIIGERTIVSPGTCLAGNTKVGSDCYIWQGVITRSNISICDGVILGAGSLVLKDITKPGVYFGSPAKYIKPYDKTLR